MTMYPSEPEYIRTVVNGRNEVLEILNTGEEITKFFLGKAGEGCPLIDASISTLLGEGAQGAVYAISSAPGTANDVSEYVVKVSETHLFALDLVFPGTTAPEQLGIFTISSHTTVGELADILLRVRGVPKTVTITANGGDPSIKVGYVNQGKYYSVYPSVLSHYNPGSGYLCKTSRASVVGKYVYKNGKKDYTDDVFVYPKGSYLCSDPGQSEYVIGVLCGSLKASGKCVNFIDTFGFGMCSKDIHQSVALRNYVFMERIEGEIDDIMMKVSDASTLEKIYDSLFLQGLFAISIMNRELGVYHYDLHPGNLFYTKANESVTKKYTHLKYVVDGKNVYVPFYGYTLKIGDFGFATKFSEPIVGAVSHTSENEFSSVPAWRDDSYDVLYFTIAFADHLGKYSRCALRALIRILGAKVADKEGLKKLEAYVNINGMYNACSGRQYKGVIDKKLLTELTKNYRCVKKAPNRPTLIGQPIRPWQLLLDSKVAGKHRVPSGSKSLKGGVLDSYFDKYSNLSDEKDADTLDEINDLIKEYDSDERTYGLSNSKVIASVRKGDFDFFVKLIKKIDSEEDDPVAKHITTILSATDLVQRYRLRAPSSFSGKYAKDDLVFQRVACLVCAYSIVGMVEQDPDIVYTIAKHAKIKESDINRLKIAIRTAMDVFSYKLHTPNLFDWMDDVIEGIAINMGSDEKQEWDNAQDDIAKLIIKILRDKGQVYATVPPKVLAVAVCVKCLDEYEDGEPISKKIIAMTGCKAELKTARTKLKKFLK